MFLLCCVVWRVWCCLVLCGIVWCCVVLCGVVWCYFMLCNVILNVITKPFIIAPHTHHTKPHTNHITSQASHHTHNTTPHQTPPHTSHHTHHTPHRITHTHTPHHTTTHDTAPTYSSQVQRFPWSIPAWPDNCVRRLLMSHTQTCPRQGSFLCTTCEDISQ